MNLPDDVNKALTTLATSGYIAEAKALIDHIVRLEKLLQVKIDEQRPPEELTR